MPRHGPGRGIGREEARVNAEKAIPPLLLLKGEMRKRTKKKKIRRRKEEQERGDERTRAQ